MAGSRTGGFKARDTNLTRHGADFYKRLGALGGKKGRTGGFYQNPELASRAGTLGGLLSRKGQPLHKRTEACDCKGTCRRLEVTERIRYNGIRSERAGEGA